MSRSSVLSNPASWVEEKLAWALDRVAKGLQRVLSRVQGKKRYIGCRRESHKKALFPLVLVAGLRHRRGADLGAGRGE